MKKTWLIIPILVVVGSIGALIYSKTNQIPSQTTPPNNQAGNKYILTSQNTVSVGSDEYHGVGIKNSWVYHSGEWTTSGLETYGTLFRFDIPELSRITKGKLHLTVQAFNNKQIKGQKCKEAKTYNPKTIASSWNPDTADYTLIRSLQANGKIIGSFTITPTTEYVEIDIPVSEVANSNGVTIEQSDNIMCRVSFFSHTDNNSMEKHPFISI